MSISKRWCFTSYAKELKINQEKCVYYVYKPEMCPTTKKLHLQGFVITKSTQRLKGAKDIIGDEKAHLEVARGTSEQAAAYCKKEETKAGDIIEWGTLPKESNKGKRSDLQTFTKYIAEYKEKTIKWIDLALEYSNIIAKYPKYVEDLCRVKRIKMIKEETRNEMTPIFIIYGKTGTGKTTFLKQDRYKHSYWKNESDKWWDGYIGEDYVIFNEWTNNGYYNVTELLKLSDHAPYTVQIKGSSAQFRSKEIWITTNMKPENILLSLKDEHRDAFKRRCKLYEIENYELVERFWNNSRRYEWQDDPDN